MLLLDHVGVRSARHYTTPLIYGQEGDDMILVASSWGSAANPAWYGNLLASARTSVQVGRRRIKVAARIATPEETPRLWAVMVHQWPAYDEYQRQTGRQIPMVVLERL